MLEHVFAVADMGMSCGGSRGRQINLVEILKTANAGMVLADADIIHDDAAHPILPR